MSYVWILYICWAVVGVVWLIGWLYNLAFAPAAAKKGSKTFILTIICLALLFANELWGPTYLWNSLILRSAALSDAGSVILLAGTIFTLWARLALGTMWSSSPVAKVDHSLKTSGPYAITRNPIYTGLLTMFAGTALIKGFGVWILYFLVGIILIEIKIRLEENLMIETFGDRYTLYRKQVPQLIPGINLLIPRINLLIPRINLPRKGQHAGG